MALFLGLMTSRTGSHDVTNNRDLPTPEYLEGVDDTSFFYGTRLEHSPHGGSCVCVNNRRTYTDWTSSKEAPMYADITWNERALEQSR